MSFENVDRRMDDGWTTDACIYYKNLVWVPSSRKLDGIAYKKVESGDLPNKYHDFRISGCIRI